MSLPLARTPREAHLYIDMHACACGERGTDQRSHSTLAGKTYWAGRYDLTCTGCGAERRFIFRVPDWPLSVDGYGGDSPSEIIDAGQWIWLADLAASSCAAQPSPDEEERRRQAEAMKEAVAAMEEILKFIPGREPIAPDTAFWTPEGRAIRDRESGRFRRPRLEVVLDSYRGSLDGLR
ncbi:MAG: hypothetical protein ACRDP6_34305 [Actinoallomurus sp.]